MDPTAVRLAVADALGQPSNIGDPSRQGAWRRPTRTAPSSLLRTPCGPGSLLVRDAAACEAWYGQWWIAGRRVKRSPVRVRSLTPHACPACYGLVNLGPKKPNYWGWTSTSRRHSFFRYLALIGGLPDEYLGGPEARRDVDHNRPARSSRTLRWLLGRDPRTPVPAPIDQRQERSRLPGRGATAPTA
jgi:hypothetical protein